MMKILIIYMRKSSHAHWEEYYHHATLEGANAIKAIMKNKAKIDFDNSELLMALAIVIPYFRPIKLSMCY